MGRTQSDSVALGQQKKPLHAASDLKMKFGHEIWFVEIRRVELLTFAVRLQRSTN